MRWGRSPRRPSILPPWHQCDSARSQPGLSLPGAPLCSPSVLITAHGDIVHFHGRTGAYLEPSREAPSLNIFRMAREGLDRVLPSAIQAALAQEAPVIRSRIAIGANGGTILTDVLIEPIPKSESLQGLLLLTFRLTND